MLKGSKAIDSGQEPRSARPKNSFLNTFRNFSFESGRFGVAGLEVFTLQNQTLAAV
jgi:hypothetical protein